MLAIRGTVVGLYFHPGFVCPAPIPPYYFYAFWIDPPVPALLIEYGAFLGKCPTGWGFSLHISYRMYPLQPASDSSIVIIERFVWVLLGE